jgi:hypothetical protein
VTAETETVLEKPHVRVYLDDNSQPIIDRELPADVALDTLSLADGAHRLVIRAEGQNGREGVQEIPFVVHNGPGIIVSGLRPHSIRGGQVRFTVDAFSNDDAFDPRRAEARSSIPVWVWVMSLFIVAWAVWYAARLWDVPAPYSRSPTYSHEAAIGRRSPEGDWDYAKEVLQRADGVVATVGAKGNTPARKDGLPYSQQDQPR